MFFFFSYCCKRHKNPPDNNYQVSPAVHNYRPVPRLLLLPLHGGYEVDHSSSLGRDSDLRPAVEVKEPDVLGLLLLARQWWKSSVQLHRIDRKDTFKGTVRDIFKIYKKKRNIICILFYYLLFFNYLKQY